MLIATDFSRVRRLADRARSDPRYPTNIYTLDTLWVLYDRVMRPVDPQDDERDRLLLSKGHGPAAFYAVLAAKGLIPEEWLDGIATVDSPLGAHPDATRVAAVEMSSGSLGHGLGLGIGQAIGLRAQGLDLPRVYVVLGDAELDEGSNHEAIAYAGAAGLSNLVAVVVSNESGTVGWPGGIASRFTVNGWTANTATVSVADGEPEKRHAAIHQAITAHDGSGPHVAVVSTDNDILPEVAS